MNIYQADPKFRPVTLVLETVDDFDKLFAIVSNVAENRISHAPLTIAAAKAILKQLSQLED